MAQTAALATAYRLTVTIVEVCSVEFQLSVDWCSKDPYIFPQAKLNKNYGVTRMDPYCRLRIGPNVLETNTAMNGSKSPYWGKTMTVGVDKDLNKFDVEIFDEVIMPI